MINVKWIRPCVCSVSLVIGLVCGVVLLLVLPLIVLCWYKNSKGLTFFDILQNKIKQLKIGTVHN